MNQLINFDDCEPAFRFYGGAEKSRTLIKTLKCEKSDQIKGGIYNKLQLDGVNMSSSKNVSLDLTEQQTIIPAPRSRGR